MNWVLDYKNNYDVFLSLNWNQITQITFSCIDEAKYN